MSEQQTRVVYEFNAQTMVFQGEALAYRDPMEPGRWLAPQNSTEAAPPELAADEQAEQVAGAWVVRKKPAPVVDQAPKVDPKEVRRVQIGTQLDELDRKAVRSLREALIAQSKGQPLPAFAVKKLGELEAEAAALRTELAAIK